MDGVLSQEEINALLNIQVVITGGDKYKGGHDVAAHDDFTHYILHIHYYIRVIKIK